MLGKSAALHKNCVSEAVKCQIRSVAGETGDYARWIDR
jgi:hypothetical protein